MRKAIALIFLSFLLVGLSGSIFRFPINWSDQNRDMFFDIGDTDFDNAARVTISKTGWDMKKLAVLASLPYINGVVSGKCSLYIYADSSAVAAADSMVIWGDGFTIPQPIMEFPQDMDSAIVVNISGVDGYLHHYVLWGQ